MSLDKFTKQNHEKFVISGSFINDLDDGELIVLADSTVTAVDVDEEDVTSTVLNAATKSLDMPKIKIQVQDGLEANSPYKITFRATTDAVPANVFELDVIMKIKEL